jgi:hypothetical protein
LSLVHFLPIFSATDATREGLHLLFGHHKQWGPSCKNGEKPYLKCLDTCLPTLIMMTTLCSGHHRIMCSNWHIKIVRVNLCWLKGLIFPCKFNISM